MERVHSVGSIHTISCSHHDDMKIYKTALNAFMTVDKKDTLVRQLEPITHNLFLLRVVDTHPFFISLMWYIHALNDGTKIYKTSLNTFIRVDKKDTLVWHLEPFSHNLFRLKVIDTHPFFITLTWYIHALNFFFTNSQGKEDPKNKFFSTVIEDDAPSNIEGAENLDATPIVLPLGGCLQ